jgi:hypothetical protein
LDELHIDERHSFMVLVLMERGAYHERYIGFSGFVMNVDLDLLDQKGIFIFRPDQTVSFVAYGLRDRYILNKGIPFDFYRFSAFMVIELQACARTSLRRRITCNSAPYQTNLVLYSKNQHRLPISPK